MTLLIVLAVISLDQLTKFLAAKFLILNSTHPVVKGIFHLTLIHNRGAAFGLLKNQIPLFIFTAVVAIILIYLSLRDKRQGRPYAISLSLILAGSGGNLIDRVLYGYVVDFLDFRIWPVFNVADSAICIGALLLVWVMFKGKNGKMGSDNII
jgi:signal peptidase II